MKLRLIAISTLTAAFAFGQGSVQTPMGVYNSAAPTITSGAYSPLQLDVNGNLNVNIKAGSSSGAVAQGSTTSGQTGGLTQAAVTTAAPAYTTAQTSPLSLTTAGLLRISLADTATNTNAFAVTIAGNQATNVAQINGVAPLMGNGVSGTGSLRVNIASDNTAFGVNLQAGTNLIGYSRAQNACGTTNYEAGLQMLTAASTAITATATCVASMIFNNTDTAVRTVSVQDQSTACNSAACQVLTAFALPPGGFLRMPFDGMKFVGGIKANSDVTLKVVLDIIGNQ